LDNVIRQDSARGSWLQNVTSIQSLLESSEIVVRKGTVYSLKVLVNTCKTFDREILKGIQISMKELLPSLLNLLEILHSDYSQYVVFLTVYSQNIFLNHITEASSNGCWYLQHNYTVYIATATPAQGNGYEMATFHPDHC
jgi:hypothetical protein